MYPNMLTPKQIQERWAKVLDHNGHSPIKDAHRRQVVAQLLENQLRDIVESKGQGYLTEAPANVSGAFPDATNLKGYDPVLISLVRRAMPNLIAFDICGVQPMTGPTGLIFALKSRYSTQGGTEALFNEADSAFSGDQAGGAAQAGTFPIQATSGAYVGGHGMTTAEGEALGDGGGTNFKEMAFSIDKVTVTAKTRALKAEYSLEIQQDLKAVHALDAETELANILTAEILAEINREIVRTIYNNAKPGAQTNVVTAGTIDLDTDADGRWSVEKFKGLMFRLEMEANAIAKETRRGRGNLLLTTSNVASALSMAGLLDSR